MIRFPLDGFHPDDDPDRILSEVHDHLHAGPLRDRFVMFAGDVEFAKVKA